MSQKTELTREGFWQESYITALKIAESANDASRIANEALKSYDEQHKMWQERFDRNSADGHAMILG